jgi:hypothetical protein
MRIRIQDLKRAKKKIKIAAERQIIRHKKISVIGIKIVYFDYILFKINIIF